MLKVYFLRRIYFTFAAFLLGLLCILAFGDLLVRLTLLPSLSAIPKVISLMLPLISVIAIPLASALSVSVVLGSIYSDNEIVLFSFLPKIKIEFIKAICIFSISIAIPFSYLVFNWAPQSYFEGKRFLVTLAQDRLSKLEPGIFHSLLDKGTFYFRGKDISNEVLYKNVLITYRDDKSGNKYTITAKKAMLGDGIIYFYDGTMETEQKGKSYIATFQESDIDIESVLNSNKDDISHREVRFLTMNQLYKLGHLKEMHTRLAQLLWQLILPLLSLMLLFWLAHPGRTNLLVSLGSASVGFLSSYAAVSLGKSMSGIPMIIIFYIVPIILFTTTTCRILTKK